ncbi:YegP family protein [Cellulophaga baltica]|uniref:YegP family protein n=1 Tax=Cellulophaga TaxID=104264 RepID=UPI001C06D1C7|nr:MULTISPECIES: YegP family protein [Cellulophaga]MBU2998157.1 YegP family protein [Cellulophaga baltica]MDO6769561.1 YegP family protein [Cellulophaga sp. 1_MG-2023]
MTNPKFEIKKSSNGKFYFNLKSKGNGEIIATSEMYNSKQSCKDGIEAVKRDAPNAEVIDLLGSY